MYLANAPSPSASRPLSRLPLRPWEDAAILAKLPNAPLGEPHAVGEFLVVKKSFWFSIAGAEINKRLARIRGTKVILRCRNSLTRAPRLARDTKGGG
jgi:hypothetical protein